MGDLQQPSSLRPFQLRVAFTSRGKREYCADKGWLGCDSSCLHHFPHPHLGKNPHARIWGSWSRLPPALALDPFFRVGEILATCRGGTGLGWGGYQRKWRVGAEVGGKGWACHGESPTPTYSSRQWGAMDGYQAGRKGIRCGEAKGWGAVRGPGDSTGLPEEGVGHGGLSGEDRAGLRRILWLKSDLGRKEGWHEDKGEAPGGDPGTGQAGWSTVSGCWLA